MEKTLERKYRFYLERLGDFYVHVFESRYYALKYLNEVVLLTPTSGDVEFEIKSVKQGFVIYEKHTFML